jgi:serine/threonine protein kinase/class 3 adenylate cyclase
MNEDARKTEFGGRVAEVAGDTDIDQLLRARNEIDALLRQQEAQFAVVFTDIVGAKEFIERFGDTAGLMMLQRHDEFVLPTIKEAGGTVVKTIGDSVLATFASAESAVQAAIKIQKRLDAYNESRSLDEQIYTRIGVNFGTGFIDEQDFCDDVVQAAAGFVKACAPAQILISSSVHKEVAHQEHLTCRKFCTAKLSGKSEPEEIYEVCWTSEERYQQLRRQLDGGETGTETGRALGRYELLEELGRGAMGVVYRAYDPTVGRIVALKTVRLDVTGPDHEELIRRLRQEAQAAGRLEHPNIVTVYDAGEVGGAFYLTMRYVKGRTLADLIPEHTLLPLKQIVLLFDQICEGLHYAHENDIVHRDLKPTNIIVNAEGTAMIVDFGIAKIAEGGTTKAGTVLGTPAYMSPEQAAGGRVDRRSDIFSLGAILYELLTGEKPFPGNTPTAIIYKIVTESPIPMRVVEPSVDPALERVVRRALEKSPSDRYQTCRELQKDLKAVGKPKRATPAPKASTRPPRTRTARDVRKTRATPVTKGRQWSPAALPLTMLLVASLAFLAWQQGWYSAVVDLWNPRARATRPSSPAGGTPPIEVAAPAVALDVETGQPSGPLGQPPPDAKRGTSEQKPPPTGTVKTDSPVEKEKPEPQKRPEPETEAAAEDETTQSVPEPDAEVSRPTPKRARQPTPEPPAPLPLTPEQERATQYLFRQANLYVGQGQYKEAVLVLKQILEIDAENKEAKELLKNVQKRMQLHQPEASPPLQ